MELLGGYASSDADDTGSSDNETPQKHEPRVIPKMADRRYLKAAPTPSILATMSLHQQQVTGSSTANNNNTSSSALSIYSKGGSTDKPTSSNNNNSMVLMNNPLKSTLMTPLQGPTLDQTQSTQRELSKSKIGKLEENITFDVHTFEEERKNFQRTGVALAPDEKGSTIVRTSYGFCKKRYGKDGQPNLTNVNNHGDNDDFSEDEDKPQSKKSKKEPLVYDSNDEITYGIWGPPTQEEKARQTDTMSMMESVGGITSSLPDEILAERAHLVERDRQRGKLANEEDTNDRENQNFDKLVERKMAHLLPPRMEGEDPKPIEATTKFHRPDDELVNYKGQSWITPPADLKDECEFGDVEHHKCYVPKKCVGRLTGHNKGVHRIRLFPKTGHLLLSGGLDGKCKVWSVQNKAVMRTYIGHSAAVRDVQFNNDGTKFVSASFDRFLRLWNTETGEVEGTFTNRRVPYVVKFYPNDDSIFVAGCSDNKIVAYDTKTGEISQEYNHHLAPVNSITFVEDHGTKMITSSDDKKVLVWEWDIGVPIKYISDPTMHSIPVFTLHPTGSFLAGQSLDNQIVVYQGSGKFALQRKKKFTGHQVAGYACDIAISPDGQFLCSGDGNGKVCFWEWRRHKMLQKYRAHEKGPTIGCVWHPTLPSTVFTCGWDGVIKMWQ